MKHILFPILFLATVLLFTCTVTSTIPASESFNSTATISSAAPATSARTPVSEVEAEIRDVVERFGKRLQNVSLQAPDAEIESQSAQFVSTTLLEKWKNNILTAPDGLFQVHGQIESK